MIQNRIKKMNNTVFDVAVGPALLLVYAGPILMIIILVLFFVVVTLKLIDRARKKSAEAESSIENNESSGKDA